MKLIIGLGNPGEKYEKTRHNVGFSVLEELANKWAMGSVKWEEDKKSNSLIINHQSLAILAKPQTMVNASGFAVAKLVNFYHVELALLPSGTGLAETWVVHDDLDLPLGKIKIRTGGGTGGHHGVESIVEKIGSGDFVRFRLGIGRPQRASENIGHREIERYVLEEFSGKEKKEAEKMVKKAVEAIILALEKGIEASMNKFNLK